MIIRTLYALCNHRCRYISLLEFKHEAIPTLLLLCNLYFKIVPRCRFDSMIIARSIHRMPAPEGYCILVFEELGEQEEENTPGIPSGSLIFNPHDVENRTNIGELFSGRPFP